MISKDLEFPDEFHVSCDKCSWHEKSDSNNFNDVKDEMKENGWKIEKRGACWFHICPSCQETKEGKVDREGW